MTANVYLGIDIGTSGIRGSAINAQKKELASHHISFEAGQAFDLRNEQNPNAWAEQLLILIRELCGKLKILNNSWQIKSIAIDGTSGTLIACKKDGSALSPALMYNDQQSQLQAKAISQFAPAESAVHGASSSLAKAMLLLERFPETEIFCHQADWLAATLTGHFGLSDENNCLKMGYDSIHQQWPGWLKNTIAEELLPEVVTPGTPMGKVKPALIDQLSLAEDCIVVAGTTDSNAAVLATGASQAGDAVTSLGSTLVIKLFSDKPLFNPEYGIYSHRLNNHWLVGGASNSGGNVLLQYFTQSQLDAMTPHLNPEKSTGLNYYPLPTAGERFPVNDVNKQNNTQPRPASDVEFFQALLEGIAGIEAEGYKKLQALGATQPKRIFTAGGGSKNAAWTRIREKITGLPVLPASHSEASYGSALLARQGYNNRT